MSNLVVRLNTSGVGELLKSPELKDILKECADEVEARCGDGYETDTSMQSTRVIASVSTKTRSAVRDNSENSTLLRAVSNPL